VFLEKVTSRISGGERFPRIDFDDDMLRVFDNIGALDGFRLGNNIAPDPRTFGFSY